MKKIDEHGVTRFLGKWRGRVSRVDDPKKQGRICCLIPDATGSVESVWCLPSMPGNDFKVPEKGDQVWVEFEQGDSERPVWTGYVPSSEAGALPAAPNLLAKDDNTSALMIGKGGGKSVLEEVGIADYRSDGSIKEFLTELFEPITHRRGEYPNVRGERSGAIFREIDSTPGAERIEEYGPAGSYREIGSSGQVTEKVRTKKSEWIEGSKQSIVTGQETAVVHGDEVRDVKKRQRVRVKRDRNMRIEGSETRFVGGKKVETIGGIETPEDPQAALTELVGGKVQREAGQLEEVTTGDRTEVTLGTQNVLVNGPLLMTIQNKDFATGQTVGWSVQVNAGAIEIKGSQATGAALKIDPAGRITLGNNVAEIFDLFDQLIDALLASVTPTMLGPQPLSITTDGTLAKLKALLAAVKG